MIKTVNINLGGIVYQIDEDAYEVLRQYLDSLNQYYKYTEGRDEIVSDIEARIAEIFAEKIVNRGTTVITMADVDDVVKTMGKPEDFDVDGEQFEERSNTKQNQTSSARTTRRLYRDPDNAIIAGVGSGLSAYFGITDPLWIRLTLILLTIFSVGAAPLIYILLWIILPKATTTAQKLEMSGKAVNISNMEKKIREEFSHVGENLKDFATRNDSNSSLRKIVNGIGKVFGAIAKLFLLLFKLIFILVAFSLLVAGVVTLIASLFSFLILMPLSIKYIFASAFGWILALIGGVLVFTIPILLIIYLPLRVFTKYRVRNKNAGIYGVGLFLIGVVFMSISAYEVNSYFSTTETVTSEKIITAPYSDTLYVKVNQNEEEFKRLDYDLRFNSIFSFTKRLETASDFVELDVIASSDSTIYLETKYRSDGKNDKKARVNAKSITHQVKYEGDNIIIDPYFGLGKNKKWRNQKVKLSLSVPEGTIVVFSHDAGRLIDNAYNTESVSGYTIAGNRWKMTDGLLAPMDSVLDLSSNWSKKNMKHLNFKNFDELDIKGAVDIEIAKGDNYEVYMLANRNVEDEIEIEQNGKKLSIYQSGKKWNIISIGFLRSRNYISPKFFIEVPALEEIHISGQSDLEMKDFKQENFTLSLTGQSDAILENVEFENLTVDMYGQTDIYISGKATKLMLDGSGQSDFDGEEFETDRLFIDLSDQSDALMTVNDKVEAELSGQSDFEYWGNPEVQQTTTGQSYIGKRD